MALFWQRHFRIARARPRSFNQNRSRRDSAICLARDGIAWNCARRVCRLGLRVPKNQNKKESLKTHKAPLCGSASLRIRHLSPLQAHPIVVSRWWAARPTTSPWPDPIVSSETHQNERIHGVRSSGRGRTARHWLVLRAVPLHVTRTSENPEPLVVVRQREH